MKPRQFEILWTEPGLVGFRIDNHMIALNTNHLAALVAALAEAEGKPTALQKSQDVARINHQLKQGV